MIVKGTYYLINWNTESGFSDNWIIKLTDNKWINNEMDLDWIKYFNIYIKSCSIGIYWMLIINGHRSHMSVEFNDYCKFNNIIIVNMPVYSSYLLQLLDIGIFSPLKTAYGHQINLFIRVFINHITKSEFFIAYLIAYDKIFIEKNNFQRSRYFTLKFRLYYFKIEYLSLYVYIF